jgi:putative transposase
VARTSAAISGAALWVPPNVHPDEEALDALLRRSVRNRMKRDLAIRALKMAIAFRAPLEGCIHHTDRGGQYCSHDYRQILRKNGFKASMSEKGNCYDNAAVETFFKTIKAEMIWRDNWDTRRHAEMAIFECINGF